MGPTWAPALGVLPVSRQPLQQPVIASDHRRTNELVAAVVGYLGELEVCKKLCNLRCGKGANLAFEIHTLGVQRPANTPTW
jgi:hypothetical protein